MDGHDIERVASDYRNECDIGINYFKTVSHEVKIRRFKMLKALKHQREREREREREWSPLGIQERRQALGNLPPRLPKGGQRYSRNIGGDSYGC